MEAVIIFNDGNNHWTKKLLHPVNHCCVCVADKGLWLVVESTSLGIRLRIEESLPKGVYYHKIEVYTNSIGPGLFTCVGLAKHMAGVRNPFILTPWQLLNYFRNQKL